MFPQADLFAVIDLISDQDRARRFSRRAKTTLIQRMPRARAEYRSYLPLMPIAIEQLGMSGYDLSHAVAKGILTGPDQRFICYCFTPIRYAWDLQHQYLAQTGITGGLKSAIARLILHYMRQWDLRTVNGVDEFIAISHYIARRIKKTYGRDSQFIYRLIDIDAFPLCTEKEDFYITASRLVSYKRVDLIVEAFAAMLDKRLIVVGDRPELPKLRDLAGANVTMLGYQSNQVLLDHLQRARAFIFAVEEDFGIIPLEVHACGTPVVAYAMGGALETVVGLDHANAGSATGILFHAQTTTAITTAIRRFKAATISPQTCRNCAHRFSTPTFHNSWQVNLRCETILQVSVQKQLRSRELYQPSWSPPLLLSGKNQALKTPPQQYSPSKSLSSVALRLMIISSGSRSFSSSPSFISRRRASPRLGKSVCLRR